GGDIDGQVVAVKVDRRVVKGDRGARQRGGASPQDDVVIVKLGAGGRDGAAVDLRGAAGVGRDAGQCGDPADDAVEGRQARGVDDQGAGAVEGIGGGGAEGDVGVAGAGQRRRGGPQGDVV